MKTERIVIGIVLLSSLTLGGCATVSKEDLAEVRAVAEKAAADAAEAKTLAAEANNKAAAAMTEAEAAKAAAEAANRKAEETETKIDRMFRKSMYK